jgi:hypothetical protein
MQSTIIGVFNNHADAEDAVTELRALGVADTDLSYVAVNNEGDMEATDGAGKDIAGGAASGAAAGTAIGAIAGLAVANGVLPGLGTLFVAGPIAASLGLTGAAATTAAGAITGAAAGGIVGALTGLGVSAADAKTYEDRVRDGGILIGAKSALATGVRNVFAKHNAEEIREYTNQ